MAMVGDVREILFLFDVKLCSREPVCDSARVISGALYLTLLQWQLLSRRNFRNGSYFGELSNLHKVIGHKPQRS